ncbi:MAG TPA: hypothetical protein VFN61_13025 [Acidimicrobiales bacterium]|nr:hypothetical protein [Acidimicrobiales bacterium]
MTMRVPDEPVRRRSRRGLYCLAVSAAALAMGGSGALLLLDRPARGVSAALMLTAALYAAISGLLFLTYRCETMAGPAWARAGNVGMAPPTEAPREVIGGDPAALGPAIGVPAFVPALGLVVGVDSAA